MGQLISRRALCGQAMRYSLAGALLTVAGGAFAQSPKICADPKALDAGQQSLRKSLNYVEAAPNPNEPCGKCSFFQATPDGCGSCAIFSGPANAHGHCDSWSPKA